MRRRFNYTGRKKIRKSDLSFTITEDEQGTHQFYADIDISNYELPSDAKVWVEAYDRNAFMRFFFGSVAKLNPDSPCILGDFAGTDSYQFRVKVVDNLHQSRLLAVADSINPVRHDDDEAVKSLLRVSLQDLGQVPWKLDYPGDNHPVLVINNRIDAGKSLARSDPFFQALVLPAIFEQVLRHILLEDDYAPSAEPQENDTWKESWLQFAANLPGNTPLVFDQSTGEDVRDEWIEDAREGFCKERNAIRIVKSALKETD